MTIFFLSLTFDSSTMGIVVLKYCDDFVTIVMVNGIRILIDSKIKYFQYFLSLFMESGN